MCEVTRYNFESLYPEIENDLKAASFISIDCEFSALFVNETNKNTLFDTPHERYRKLRENCVRTIPFEIGVTPFYFDDRKLSFIAKPYKFCLFPANAFHDKSYAIQISAYHFLYEHDFNFNACVFNGIPYINRKEELDIRRHFNHLYDYCVYILDMNYKKDLETHIKIIRKWFNSKESNEDKMIYDVSKKNRCYSYILHRELRAQFPNTLWTYIAGQHFKIRKVSPEVYKELNQDFHLEQSFIDSLLGFTRIFRLLTELKTPIIGHNCLQDLIVIINNFEGPLPKSYESFKNLTHQLFPRVFDTKTLSFETLKLLPEAEKFETGLKDLYDFFKSESGRHLAPRSPRIEIAEQFNYYTEDKFHDAGWDSYCTGYIFIRIFHCFAHLQALGTSSNSFATAEYLNAIAKFENQVNVIRASVSCINLVGSDPVSRRPPCLLIKSTNGAPVNIIRATLMLRDYGSIEIKPFYGKKAIAAVANYGSLRRILQQFKNHDDYVITKYNPFIHSPFLRLAIFGLIASGSVLTLFMLKK